MQRNVSLSLECREAGVQRGEGPVVGNRIVDHDRIEQRQLLPWRSNDANRPTPDAVAHHPDRVLDGRQPVPVEQRLGLPHPTRSAASEDDRAHAHLSA